VTAVQSSATLNWVLGEYVMESVIRAGGRSTVYAARRNGSEDVRALKVVSIGSDPGARSVADAERRGAELQQEFARHHGLVPKVEAIGEARSCLYVAMEYVPGEDLLDVLARGPLPQARALDIAIALATFLEKTHRFIVPGRAPERIIHADLKPSNVRIRPDGSICVLDFGIAKAMAEQRLETTQKWGTRQYMSPEWLHSGTIDEQVDYWSLGILLYEMLAGYRPFRRFEKHDNQLEDAIRRRERPEAPPAYVNHAVRSVIGRLLAPEVAQRYSGAAEIRAALETCRRGLPADAIDASDASRTHLVSAAPLVDVPTLPAPKTGLAAADVATLDAPARQDVLTEPAPRRAAILDSPATEPCPVPGAGLPPPLPNAIVPPKSRPPGRWGSLRRVMIAAGWMIFAVILASEGIACVAAERLRSDAAVANEQELDAALTRRTQLAGWTLFDAALRFRADPVLKDRLVSLADIVIADYRQEQPTVGRPEWEQARNWLTQAASLYPGDRQVRAKLRYTEGHVQRLLAARRTDGQQTKAARQSYYTAIQKFREAASLDSDSPDPYLGMTHTYVYGLGDVDNAVESLKAAEKRGYKQTRRERAQIGDGYRTRGERLWRSARNLEGDQQRDAYERAQEDFKRCVESFTPIVEFANAADQLRRCESRLHDLDEHREPWWRRLLDLDNIEVSIKPSTPETPRPDEQPR